MDHPTTETLAELREDLLDAAQAVEVRAHVAGCAECRQVLAQLDAVSELLAAEGGTEVPIPAPVATSVQQALARAAAERAADVPSLADRRDHDTGERSESPTRSRTSRWVLLAGAAAAAVVVVGAAAGVLREEGSSSDAGGAGDARDRTQLEQGDAEAAESTPTESTDADNLAAGPQRINPEQLDRLAREFATGGLSARTPRGDCALVADTQPDDVRITQYGAGSELSLLLVDEAQGTYRLLDCRSGAVIYRGKL